MMSLYVRNLTFFLQTITIHKIFVLNLQWGMHVHPLMNKFVSLQRFVQLLMSIHNSRSDHLFVIWNVEFKEIISKIVSLHQRLDQTCKVEVLSVRYAFSTSFRLIVHFQLEI